MATVSENLQIIKNSTLDIKQAIIDKGGEVGDLTTYAAAITNLPSGGDNKKITFTGTIFSDRISGTLTGVPEKGLFIIIYMSDSLIVNSTVVESDGRVGAYIVTSPEGVTIIKLLFCPISAYNEQMSSYVGDEVYDVEFIQE